MGARNPCGNFRMASARNPADIVQGSPFCPFSLRHAGGGQASSAAATTAAGARVTSCP